MGTIDIRKIIEVLPQRYPFVMIDRVLELVPNERITAIKNVSSCEPWFAGHFPENPIMPGVLLVEAMCQAGGVLVNLSGDDIATSEARYLTGLDKVRFRKRIVPGDTVVITARIVKKKLNMIKIEAVAEVAGKRAAEAQIMASMGGSRDTSDSDR
ncbi:MAG: 3-hydroxyacyl-ACP dehydratase FabZ [Thermodesulfobacteriota bacterium]|nr:3-hydroxyacyl-ACP dehydratase FabZ [Thermodesulfobacteriota bacterium]